MSLALPPAASLPQIAKARNEENARLRALTEINAGEILRAFHLHRTAFLDDALRLAVRIPARKLARKMLRFDEIAGAKGLGAAGAFVLSRFTRDLQIEGAEHIPARGPLLVLSNHPGMVDAMALWSGLRARTDLRVIAAERELLELLPNTHRYLFCVPSHGPQTALLRRAVAHLKNGGALLSFPAGNIEPDPCLRASGRELRWSQSACLLARAVPEVKIVPAAVGGVISPRARRNPAAALFRDPKERDWAAATLQVLFPMYRDTSTQVIFGKPLAVMDSDGRVLQDRVRELMGRMRPAP
jgi:1-acyl-sn-glycerol-3-phosphate acyltransferase